MEAEPCRRCGQKRVLRKVTFAQSVGCIVVNFYGAREGHYCRSCVLVHFFRTTGKTFLLGWWSFTGLFTTPFFICFNIYMLFRGLLGRPASRRAEVEREERARDPLAPHQDRIRALVSEGCTLEEVAEKLKEETGLPKGRLERLLYPLSKYDEA